MTSSKGDSAAVGRGESAVEGHNSREVKGGTHEVSVVDIAAHTDDDGAEP